MLFGLGQFRFIVPNFAIDDMDMRSASRIGGQEVIGSKPITQLLGPSGRTLDLASTFFPLHLNPGGERLLAEIETACEAQTPLSMIRMQGFTGIPEGRWIIASVGNSQTLFAPGGRAQVVKASIQLQQYVMQGIGNPIGLFR